MILARARSLQFSRTGALPEMCHRGAQVGTLQIWTGTVRVKGLWIKAGLISTQADAGTGSVRNGDKKAGPFTGEAGSDTGEAQRTCCANTSNEPALRPPKSGVYIT